MDTNTTDTRQPDGLAPAPSSAWQVGDYAMWHWADDLGAPPDRVRILGRADEKWRGPNGITILQEDEGVRYVALPNELHPMPNTEEQRTGS